MNCNIPIKIHIHDFSLSLICPMKVIITVSLNSIFVYLYGNVTLM